MEIGGVIAIILMLVLYAFIAASQGDGTIKGTASSIDQISGEALLNGHALWQITILRKSGYIHDVREVRGDADEAISKALSSCRRAGIYGLIVTKNETKNLEFYSINRAGRGKAIGGFRISALSEIIGSYNISDALATEQPVVTIDGNVSVAADVINPSPAAATDCKDSSGFPEQDAWEGSVYELGGRPCRCDVKLGFRYTDSNGATTNRQIRTKAFVPWMDEDHLVLGFCNYRKANRSFVTSRMEEVVDLETGECLADLDRFLIETYEASDYKKVDDFIDTRMSVVECLLYLARLDGNLTKAQKSLITGYISEASGATIVTDTIAKSLIKDFADDLTPQQFRKLVSQMQKNQPENLLDLLDLGVRVVGARRGSTAGGTAAMAVISGTKG